MRSCLARAFIVIFLSTPLSVWGQEEAPASGEDTGLEEIYDRFETDEEKKQAERKSREDRAREQKVEKQVESVSDLGTLAPFSDIAVIQRKFLPRTSRFEASANFLLNTNNQFFNNVGVGVKLAYSFNEKYGLEAAYLYLASAKREITRNLEDKQQIGTESFVEPESFTGLHFKWTPIYGKVAWFEKRIIPFEIYFTPGYGVTATAAGESEPTMSVGAGQLFALSKATAVRWDFVWNSYQSTTRVSGIETVKDQNDLLLMIGYSFFFPEADYR